MKLGRKPPSADADLLKAEKELTAANRELAWELSKVAVDVAGFVDPTPISDAVSMGMSLIDGDYIGASLSLVSMVPYAGDALAKTTKGARAAKKILGLQKKIAALAAKVRALKTSKGASKAASKTIAKASKKPPTGGVCLECAKRAKNPKIGKNLGKRRTSGPPGSPGGPKGPAGTYEFTATNGKKYIGQSGNISRRLREHKRSGMWDGKPTVIQRPVAGGKTAREIAEQRRIDELGGIMGGRVANKRNPIGPNRQHLLKR